MNKISSIFRYLLIGSILVSIDQALKYLIENYYPRLLFCNSGIIFGWLKNELLGCILLIFGLLLLIYIIVQQKKWGIANFLALTFIISGAVANLIDRLRFNCVIDYIHFFNLNVFNLADIYIFVGILLYTLAVFRTNKK